ncbi:MarR family transcriptional regulator [Bacillus toyonensis]|nr:MarR family transcriptional regulator [Bacillus toyonensis]PEL50939.1 MarR family transcriptional regulator [Bacillus toyonensis]PHE89567.1 MarR family transcriptional regulator [Bacillus toyonensis]
MMHLKEVTYNCGLELLSDMITGKWKTLILFYLISEKKRFSALKSLLPGITSKMLTKQLRELEQSGLIERKIYQQVPMKVEYSLTSKGYELEAILFQMCEIGTNYLEDICEPNIAFQTI